MGAFLLAPVYILVNVYVAWWLLQYMQACHVIFQSWLVRGTILTIYGLLATTLLTAFLIQKNPLHRILKVISNYWLGTFGYILMTIIGFDIVRIIGKKSRWLPETWFGSRKAFLLIGGVAIVIIVIASVYGIVHAKQLVIDRREIVIKKSCKQTELKVALVADWHLGYSIGEKKIRQMVDTINKEHVDLICIAGDQFDNEFDAIENPDEIIEILKELKSTYGVYAVYGNHDLNEKILAGFTFQSKETMVEDERFEQFLSRANIQVITEQATYIDQAFYVVGREDPQRVKKLHQTRKSPEQLLKHLDKSKPIIVIDHQPKQLNELENAGADLVLSGHTHDGQMFPGNILTSFFWKNSNGVVKVGNMYSCVTSGVGIWGPDMRVGTDSEVMILEVKFQS